ncbi:MAG: 50S ribosomal protein L4 [Nanoarchaeota archaeon]
MKMKTNIIDNTGKKVSDYDIEILEDIRDDIFKKAVLAERSLFIHNTGANPLAGKRVSINVSKQRQRYRSTYGRSASRVPKKAMWRRGRQLRFVGAFAPGTVGGRRAHPRKAEKNWLKDMNNKEWLKALKVGLVASMNQKFVVANGQKVPKTYPFILDNVVEDMNKTKDVKAFLDKVGFNEELQRTTYRKVRAGKGTMRNRTYKIKRGPMIVVSSIDKPLLKAARNIRGFEVLTSDVLMVSDFGMSDRPGRAVIFTKAALEEFMEVFN